MPPDPPKTLSDARLIGLAARTIRRARGMTVQQVAAAMNLPPRTYEYFESGSGRLNHDYVQRFAVATDSDPYSLLISPALGSTEFARNTADIKLMLIFLIALGEFDRSMGPRLRTLDPRDLIEAFTETFRKLETESRQRDAETEAWLEAGRDLMAGRRPDGAP